MIVHERDDEIWEQMKSDCSKCSGLCCVALFFSKIDGFPKDKIAGTPCNNLLEDYRCKIHPLLESQNMKGCIGYDCFGAGQQVTQNIYEGQTWNDKPNHATEIFHVFTTIYQLYQIRYYLIEAMTLIAAKSLKESIQSLIEENIRICNRHPQSILSFELEEYRNRVNLVLKQACRLLQQTAHSENKKIPAIIPGGNYKKKDMSGTDLSSQLLIAANFEEAVFKGTILLGSDTRDTDFRDADLSEAVFLTQGQVNSAKGNRNTKLPYHLDYPPTWK